MIAFFIALLVALCAAEWYSLRHSLDGIEFECEPDKRLAEPDEELQLLTRVTNRRRRIVPFLRITQYVPLCFKSDCVLATESVTEKKGSVSSAVYMMPRQRMLRRTPFSLPQRGRYLFTGARLSGGDFMGLSERAKEYPQSEELVILPRALDSITVQDVTGGMMGEISVNRFLFEDPVLTVGFRDYTGREPMKAISWTATARTGKVMVRQYDYTVERHVTVLLNTDTFGFGAWSEELLEKCFSLARAVCEQLEEKQIAYTFIHNAAITSPESDLTLIPEGLGMSHLARVLESMGRAECRHGASLKVLLDTAAARADRGTIHIFITAMPEDAREGTLEPLRERTGSEIYTVIAQEVSRE